mgnify:CR=1 FL=1
MVFLTRCLQEMNWFLQGKQKARALEIEITYSAFLPKNLCIIKT